MAEQNTPRNRNDFVIMELPDGRKVRLPKGMTRAEMAAALNKLLPKKPGTFVLEQTTTGVNEGLAATLGAPVDFMTAGLNAGVSGINRLTGSNIPQISNHVGGSHSFERLMASIGATSEAEPETAMQRYARSIGRETGALTRMSKTA